MSAKPIEVSNLLSMLWHRRWSFLRYGIAAAAVAYASAQLFPRRYSSEGLMIVESEASPLSELGSAPAPRVGNQPDHTIVDVLRSRELLESVVHSLNLTHNSSYNTGPRLPPALLPVAKTISAKIRYFLEHVAISPLEIPGRKVSDPKTQLLEAQLLEADAVTDAIRYLERNIKTDYGEGSRVLTIHFEAASPAMAAAVVNSLMQNYIAQDILQKKEMIGGARRWLSERVAVLHNDMDATDAIVQNFRRSHNLLEVGAGSLEALQLTNAQSQLSAARQDLARQEAALNTLQQRQMAGRDGAAAASQEALASPVIQMLRQRETDTIERIANATSLGSQHPEQRALEEELNKIRAQLHVEVGKIVQSIRRDVEVARERVAELESEIGALESKAGNSAEAEITLKGLERNAEVKRQTYNAFLIREEQLGSAEFSAARILSPAVPAARPDPAHTPLVVLFAAIGGVALAISMTLLRHMLGGKISSMRELSVATSMPVLGSLPWVKGSMAAVVIQEGQSPSAETLRALRFNIQETSHRAATVLVTSSDSAEGKTTIAEALARRFAADGQRVLLIEGDLRRPKLAEKFEMDGDACLERLLTDGVPLEQAVHVDPHSGLHCLLAAGTAANPLALLTSNAFDILMLQARSKYQLIVLDSPPVLRVVDPVVLSRWSDVTLFAVRCNRTSVSQVMEALRRFPEAQRLGIVMVLNRVRRSQLDPRDYYSGYNGRLQLPVAQLSAVHNDISRNPSSPTRIGWD